MGVRTGGRVVAAALALALSLAVAAAAGADVAPKTARAIRLELRPTQARSALHYTVPEAKPFAGRFVVVHYVRRVPDYVEAAAKAGDASILFFGRQGFKAPLRDTAGPNRMIDIYVKKLPAAILGLTIPAPERRGGAWVTISPTLETTGDPKLVSLQDTIAHELFHMIQLS